MSDDEYYRGSTPDERLNLRNLLRDPAWVKDHFNHTRDIFERAKNNAKTAIQYLEKTNQNSSIFDNFISDIVLNQLLSDVLEAVALNQNQLRELLKEVIDSQITNNTGKLKELRQKIDE